MNRLIERTNKLADLSPEMQREVIAECKASCRILRRNEEEWLCVNKGHACFNCQDKALRTLSQGGKK